MDATTPEYSEERFKEIKEAVEKYLRKVGFRSIVCLPISGLKGENLINPSENMAWYKGPTLLNALDMIPEPRRPSDKPLRLPVQSVYKIGGIGVVPAGKVETGVMKPGMKLTFGPVGLTAEVNSIQMQNKALLEAGPGDIVGFAVENKNVAAKNLNRGFVASNSQEDPAKGAVSFTSKIFVLNHPGRIGKGYTPVLDCHTAHIAVKFEEILSKVERKSDDEIKKKPEFLKNGDAGIVKMVPLKPLVVETFTEFPPLGRFAVRDMRQTVAVGVVKSVIKHD